MTRTDKLVDVAFELHNRKTNKSIALTRVNDKILIIEFIGGQQTHESWDKRDIADILHELRAKGYDTSISNPIAEWRRIRGLSQSQLAKKSDVSIKTIQKYESGERDFNKARLDIACKLAKALECEITDLI